MLGCNFVYIIIICLYYSQGHKQDQDFIGLGAIQTYTEGQSLTPKILYSK